MPPLSSSSPSSVNPPPIPSASVLLEWSNISYTATKNPFSWQRMRRVPTSTTILNDVSGSARSGQLVAVIGPSGAGKTSLLAAISQRLRSPSEHLTGCTAINGRPMQRAAMIRRSAFVTQFDIAPDGLTVREHMRFMCQLRGLDASAKGFDAVLATVGLIGASDSLVTVLSGGERKKLNLATEILTDPDVIFCDEPTTGLDSFSARSVVQTLRDLADSSQRTMEYNNNWWNDEKVTRLRPKVVLCSIHQPSSDVFECFTHVILMRSGKAVFQGTVQEALAGFAKLGRVCPRAFNSAEFLVKTISDETFEIVDKPSPVIIEHQPPSMSEWKSNNNKNGNVCWLSQVIILLRRSSVISRRSGREFIYKLTTFILTSFFIGCLYMDVDHSDQLAIQNITGFVFNLNAQIIFATAYNEVFYYPSKLPVLRRETGEQIYSLSAYMVANVIGCIPRSAIECFVFLGIVQPFVGFINGAWMFAVVGVTLTLVAIPATAYGLMLSGLFESVSVTSAMAPPFDVVLCVVAGFYIKLRTFWYLRYLSPFFYANEAVMVLIWTNIDRLECTNADGGGYCLQSGTEVLASMDYGTTYDTVWLDYAGLFGCAVVMNAIGYIGVRRMVNRIGFY